ncbi:MAG: NAD(P)H-hydrate dehydratase [Endozoicomonadaceae bacterium]|nr:NAD(P)H-hydrate dehydratase [Endozoicomonadaceae bacterium]
MSEWLPEALYTAEQARHLDAIAINDYHINGFELMKRAGQAAFDRMLKRWPTLSRGGILQIFCGAGNNGGDGYVVACLARQRYLPVRVIALRNPDELKGDALRAWLWFRDLGGTTESWSNNVTITGSVLVDAMLGTGLIGDVQGDYLAAIQRLNASGRSVLAVDIPSGLSADTGAALGDAVQATMTVTFIGVKQGLLTGAGMRYCGELCFSSLAVPDEIYQQEAPSSRLLREQELSGCVSPRVADANKGTHGHLLVIGGDHGMGGAVIMAAEAALRTGVGLLTVATRQEHVNAINSRCPEIMARGISTPASLSDLLTGKTAIVVGPGLGQSDWSRALLSVAMVSGLPLLVDADALNLMAKDSRLLDAATSSLLLTPHPGEASRLLQVTIAEIQQNRFSAVTQLQQLCGGVVVLKGAGSLVFDGQSLSLCGAGNPGMAVAGMGDVLSGVIGSFLAQGYEPATAGRVGVWLHAAAGDDCAEDAGQIGMKACDLLPFLRRRLNQLANGGI